MPLAFLSDVGPAELILVFAAVLVFFGPKRLPEVARSIGRVMNDLRRASREFQDQIMQIEEEAQPAEPSAHPIGPESPPEPQSQPPPVIGPESGGPAPTAGPDTSAASNADQTEPKANNPHDLAG